MILILKVYFKIKILVWGLVLLIFTVFIYVTN